MALGDMSQQRLQIDSVERRHATVISARGGRRKRRVLLPHSREKKSLRIPEVTCPSIIFYIYQLFARREGPVAGTLAGGALREKNDG
jgi:hypothetical protein